MLTFNYDERREHGISVLPSATTARTVIPNDSSYGLSPREWWTRMNRRNPSLFMIADTPVYFVVFDVVWLDGRDLASLPLSDRRGRSRR